MDDNKDRTMETTEDLMDNHPISKNAHHIDHHPSVSKINTMEEVKLWN